MIKYIVIAIIVIVSFEIITFISKTNKDNSKSKKIMSNTEKQIAKLFDDKSIRYKCQYTFNGCKDKKKLPFDFAVFDEKRNLLFLIEYDGEHHFHPVRYKTFQNADRNYSICKKHDEIKNNFCKRNNIDLVRIPYYERKDLYKILYKKLRQYNLLK